MTIEVTTTVTTAELKVGDRTGAGQVTAIERKQVWAHVTVTDIPKPVRCKLDSPWTVTRTEKTEAEQAAEIAEFIEARLRNARAISRTNLAKIAEKITKALATGSPFAVSNWDFATLASAQAMEDLWMRVDTIEDHVAVGTIDPMTFIEIVEKIKDRCREDLLSFRANNRSSSTMSNAVEDAQLDAKRQFISTWW